MYDSLTTEENKELTHWSRFGSDGYPVTKIGRKWSVTHFPKMFATKREATAQWEKYIDILIDKTAGRI
tara:strand:+ start:1828 stop:2031 length:204 start_codon:yes stop_codon:yes gene_type:complete